MAEEAHVQQRVIAAELGPYERDRRDDPDRQPGYGQRVRPAPLGTLVDAEYQAADGDRGQDRSGDVETGFGVLPGMRHDDDRGHEGRAGEGQGDGEHPRPGRVVDDRRGRQKAEDAPGPGDPGPRPHGPSPFVGRKAGGDDGEGDRHDHRGPDAGDDAQTDEHLRGVRERRREVGGREHDQPQDQDRLSAPSVTDRPDGQEQRREHEGVPVDHPQQLALRRPEVLGYRLLGDVEPGDRGDDADERDAHRDQDQTAPAGVGHGLVGGVGIGGFEDVDVGRLGTWGGHGIRTPGGGGIAAGCCCVGTATDDFVLSADRWNLQ